MPFSASVLRVMIASPSDVRDERQIVHEVIEEWNAVNAEARHQVLMGIGWESHSTPEMGSRPQAIINRQLLQDADLLIAVFWTRLGSPTGKAASGTVEEIEAHMRAGKPAMLYFSDRPVSPKAVDPGQHRALMDFRQACLSLGIVEDFGDPGEFRRKLTRHVGQAIQTHFPSAGLGAGRAAGNSALLSEEARELLSEASQDRYSLITRTVTGAGTNIATNGRSFVVPEDRRSEARWRGAVADLLANRLVEDRTGKGEVFNLTALGFQAVDSLRSQVVG